MRWCGAAAMNERERLAEEASAARLELAGFERRSIVQQMSSMIAHEILSLIHISEPTRH